MQVKDAFELTVELEQRYSSGAPVWNGIDLWPLVRACIWAELRAADSRPEPAPTIQRILRYAKRQIGQRLDRLEETRTADLSSKRKTDVVFISRPVYLQGIPGGEMFDRIVDPLIYALGNERSAEKFYVSPWPENANLRYPAQLLRQHPSLGTRPSPRDVAFVNELATSALMDGNALVNRFIESLASFSRWYETGKRLFSTRPAVRSVYLTSWYSADMIGLTAAAHEAGVTVVDVQHGKQGRYQAMYSGWNAIPEHGGYRAMPDRFWCWGKPSCQHMLEASPERDKHLPFVGGFPWLDYYRKEIAPSTNSRGTKSSQVNRTILVTIQPIVKGNLEPIPDFLLSYLLQDARADDHFIIRCHPNDKRGPDYCRARLDAVDPARYSLDIDGSNLYDQLMKATHHITAFSSCCYEATAFGVPTLLYGPDSKALYSEEIASGEFFWTAGDAGELKSWLENSDGPQNQINAIQDQTAYIVSSLDLAEKIVSKL